MRRDLTRRLPLRRHGAAVAPIAFIVACVRHGAKVNDMAFAAGEQRFGHVIPRLFIIKSTAIRPGGASRSITCARGFWRRRGGLCAQGMRRVGEDKPGDRVAQQLCDLFFFPLRAVIVVHHQRLVTPRLGNGFYAGQQVGEDLVVEGGDQYADARFSAGLCGIGICDVQLRMTCAMRSAVSAATFSGVRRKRLTVILVTPANCAMSCSVTRGVSFGGLHGRCGKGGWRYVNKSIWR